jgi:uncharacterized oxidoreductase
MKTFNRIILITGGSSGIGLALAKKFLANNHTVIITGRGLEKLQKIKAEYLQLFIYQNDVTKEDDIKQLVSYTLEKFGGIDVLINNAGIMQPIDTSVENEDLKKIFSEIDINFNSPIRMVNYFLPQLKKSSHAEIINVSSGLAFVPFAQTPIYSASKVALHFWTKSIRLQLEHHHIKVIELLPPLVDTQLSKVTDVKLKPMSPDKLADLFWKAYKKGEIEITPGTSKRLKIMSRFLPNFIFRQMNRQPIPEILVETDS